MIRIQYLDRQIDEKTLPVDPFTNSLTPTIRRILFFFDMKENLVICFIVSAFFL